MESGRGEADSQDGLAFQLFPLAASGGCSGLDSEAVHRNASHSVLLRTILRCSGLRDLVVSQPK